MTLPPFLLAGQLKNDPRIAEAKKMLLEALEEHSKKIQGIKPPDPRLATSYKELVQSFNQLRGAPLWFPYIGSGIGNGALVELMDGSIKYDCISGIGPHFWGHSHPALASVQIDAALADTTMQGNLQQNNDSVSLMHLLTKSSGLDHCFLSTSGAMANENAAKIFFQKKFPASRILAFEKGFFGRSLLGSQITDKPAFREGLPCNYHVDYVPYYDFRKPEESLEKGVQILKKHIARYPDQHAFFVFELVQGEGGFHSGTPEFFRSLMEIAKQHQIGILVDEVQTFGRTPELFAYHYFGVQEFVDVVTIGKLSQVCATLFRDSFKPKPGLLSQTFTGSTTSIQVGTCMIEGLLNDGYYGPKGKIQGIHDYFVGKLKHIEQNHPDKIQGPYGTGCMIAFTPFDGTPEKVVSFAQDLFAAGVIAFIAGSSPTRIRFLLPAGAIRFEDIDCITELIEQTLVRG